MTDRSPEATSRPRVPRWLWAVLIVSLCVNFLVAGLVLRFAWGPRNGPVLSAVNAMRYADGLPGPRGDELKKSMSLDRGELRRIRGELGAAQRQAIAILTADTFDKAAFIAAQSKVLELETRLRQELRSVIPEMAERMSVAERRELVRWREGRRDREGRGGRGDRDDRRRE